MYKSYWKFRRNYSVQKIMPYLWKHSSHANININIFQRIFLILKLINWEKIHRKTICNHRSNIMLTNSRILNNKLLRFFQFYQRRFNVTYVSITSKLSLLCGVKGSLALVVLHRKWPSSAHWIECTREWIYTR